NNRQTDSTRPIESSTKGPDTQPASRNGERQLPQPNTGVGEATSFQAGYQAAQLADKVEASQINSPTKEAKELISASTTLLGGLDKNRLGSVLARIAIQQPKLADEVLNRLSIVEQAQVARAMVDELSKIDGLNRMGASNGGYKLLERVS